VCLAQVPTLILLRSWQLYDPDSALLNILALLASFTLGTLCFKLSPNLIRVNAMQGVA